jgi:hypothetical protein
MRRVLVAMAVAMIGVGAAVAQAPQTGQGLDVTLAFIRDKVAQQGPINYASVNHNSAGGADWRDQFNVEASNVTADIPACQLNFHWHTVVDGKVVYDGENGFPFGKVNRVVVTSMEADLARLAAEGCHPTYTSKVTPPVWVLTAYRADGTSNTVDFHDRDLAERVARAMRHAAELCGGTKREAF